MHHDFFGAASFMADYSRGVFRYERTDGKNGVVYGHTPNVYGHTGFVRFKYSVLANVSCSINCEAVKIPQVLFKTIVSVDIECVPVDATGKN
jgi:hypothetical protein